MDGSTPAAAPDKPSGVNPLAPEVLKPRAAEVPPEQPSQPAASSAADNQRRHRTYRPSHRATFIGLAVVGAILLINVLVLGFILKGKSANQPDKGQVTISSSVLDKLGVNSAALGTSSAKLTVGPNSEFLGTVKIAGDTNIAGPLTLNGKVSGTNATFTGLQGGQTSLNQLDVNANTTLHGDLAVGGKTSAQGLLTANQLAVVGGLTVGGNLALAGSLTTGALNVNNLVAAVTLTIGGHVITSGSRPGVSAGPCIGSNGTVSISGNDAAGTVAVNTGAGTCNGTVVNVTFHSAYFATPHVVLTPVGSVISTYYVNRSSGGFSIGFSGAGPGGYAFDYIVIQ